MSGQDLPELALKLQRLQIEVDRLQEQPPWAAEAIDALRLVDPADRALVLCLAYRLARRRNAIDATNHEDRGTDHE